MILRLKMQGFTHFSIDRSTNDSPAPSIRTKKAVKTCVGFRVTTLLISQRLCGGCNCSQDLLSTPLFFIFSMLFKKNQTGISTSILDQNIESIAPKI